MALKFTIQDLQMDLLLRPSTVLLWREHNQSVVDTDF